MKKIVFIMVALFIQLFAYNATYAIQSSSDLTDGTYTYVVSNEKAIITGTTKDISGKVVIPDKIGGYPVIEIDSCAFLNKTYLTEVVIPESVEFIDFSAFYGSGIVRVSIPSSVKSIGSSAFGSCNSLNSVYITDIEAWCNIDFANDKANPFSNGATLYVNNVITKNINIPNTITHIKKYAFYMMPINSITISDSVESIEESAFYSCRNLSSIKMGNGVRTIGKKAFYNCDGFYSLRLSNKLETIGTEAFNYCAKMHDIYIPPTVTTIPNSAFYYCTNLINVTIGKVSSIGNNAFASSRYLANVFFIGSEEEYEKIEIGSNNAYFTNARTFYNCSNSNFKGVLNVDSIEYNDGNIEYDINIVPCTYFSGTIIIAVYSNEGALLELTSRNISASYSSYSIKDVEIKDTMAVKEKPFKYKVFLWSSLNDLQPLAVALENQI